METFWGKIILLAILIILLEDAYPVPARENGRAVANSSEEVYGFDVG
jgi:hypothetical protein